MVNVLGWGQWAVKLEKGKLRMSGWQPVGLGTFDPGAAAEPCTLSPPDHVARDSQTLQPRDGVHHVPEGLHLQQGRLPPCRSVEGTGQC